MRALAFTVASLVITPLAAMIIIIAGLVTSESNADPGTGTLFGTDAGGGNLITVDPQTGEGAVVGPMVGPESMAEVFPALAVDPTTGLMYAGGGAGVPELVIVDPESGNLTLVGDAGLGFASIGGMDFRSDGTLFAAVNLAGDGGTGSDHLAIIDKNTGVATVVGPFGECEGVVVPTEGEGECTIEGIEGIAFDESGTLWGSLSERGAAGDPGLYTIDTETGSAVNGTFVAPIEDEVGMPPSGGVVSLQFECDGTLFGGTATAIGEATDGGRLITIDPPSGLFEFVGMGSATVGSSLGALAFQDPCPTSTPTPTPTATPNPTPTATPTGGRFGSSGGCTSVAGAAPLQLGTAMANILIPLVPALAIGFRVIRKKKKGQN
jgi:hypothetical protein